MGFQDLNLGNKLTYLIHDHWIGITDVEMGKRNINGNRFNIDD